INATVSRGQYQFALEDANPDEFALWVPRLMQRLQQIPQLEDVATSYSENGLSAYVPIDRATAGRFGITPATVDNALYDSFGQRIVSTIFTQSNQYRVILEADPAFQQSLSSLGVLYESYIHPITILSTLPSAGLGALLALMLDGSDLSIIAIIGIILLIGIVKKNGIMMVDFALEAQREEGKPPREAIFQASLLRFRPIMMTTMAALFAALPLMLGTGTGSELRHPLGVTIVGGLILSQALTLFTTPVIYLGFDRLGRATRRRFGHLLNVEDRAL